MLEKQLQLHNPRDFALMTTLQLSATLHDVLSYRKAVTIGPVWSCRLVGRAFLLFVLSFVQQVSEQTDIAFLQHLLQTTVAIADIGRKRKLDCIARSQEIFFCSIAPYGLG